MLTLNNEQRKVCCHGDGYQGTVGSIHVVLRACLSLSTTTYPILQLLFEHEDTVFKTQPLLHKQVEAEIFVVIF